MPPLQQPAHQVEPTSSSPPSGARPSRLARSHPDHPTLADLPGGDGSEARSEEIASSSASATPPTTATPLSLSEPSHSPETMAAHDTSGAGPRPGHGESVNLSSGGALAHSQSPEQQDASSEAQSAPAMARRPGGLNENPNARSKSITVADGDNTYGALNRHPVASSPSSPDAFAFRVGVSEDRNRKCRRTMEDAHSFVYDFGGVRGQGYFAVFDGHAGKQAAEWCGQNFHEYLLDAIVERPTEAVPDLLNETFHVVDDRLSRLASQDNTHSGCTAVTAFLRIEEDEPQQQQQPAASTDGTPQAPKGFINPELKSRGLMHGEGEEELERLTSLRSAGGGSAHIPGGSGTASPSAGGGATGVQRKSSGRRIKDFVGRLTGSRDGSEANLPAAANDEAVADEPSSSMGDASSAMPIADGTSGVDLIDARSDKPLRRVLYTANVGDARAVLCRGGQAVRLTYDHKGSDAQEAKRITDAGGFVMNNRVNGVLAVTRSLGDSSMKEFVVGAPYTTETTLDADDEFLIVACDGLWDVCEDQDAVNLIRKTTNAQRASQVLLDHAIQNYSTDNLSVMVIRFKDFTD